MLAEILRAAFARARERFGLVLVDFLWKAVWFVSSVAAVILVAAWFGSELRHLAWEDTGARATNVLIAVTALREFWRELRGQVLVAALLLIAASAIAWFLLEAFIHSRMISAVAGFSRCLRNPSERGLKPATACLISRVTTTAILATAGAVLILVWLRGAPGLAIILFAILAFFLTIVETLIRADAVELLGTDLIRVTALIGILLSFEMMVAASLAVILTAGFLNAARLSDALAMLGFTGITAVFLSVLHSFLLLVRFSAVGIMRQNVVAV